MKKIRLVLLLFLVTGFVIKPQIKLYAQETGYEDAQSIVFGNTYSGTFQEAYDDDGTGVWYKFSVERSGKITIVDTEYLSSSRICLYDNELHRLEYFLTESSGTTTINSYIIGGEYYIKYEDGWFGRPEHSYSFTIIFTESEESFDESTSRNDNAIIFANDIELNTTYKGMLGVNDSADYYSFTLPSAEKITINTVFKMKNIYFGLYDSDGNLIKGYDQRNYPEAGGSQIFEIELEKGAYYFSAGRTGASYGNYTFEIKADIETKVETYKITYKLNGGTNNKNNPTSYTKDTATIKLKNPTRSGYTFKGWFLDSAFKKKVTSIEKGSTGNKTFYAKWKKNSVVAYTITYKLNGGTNNKNNPASYTKDTATIKLKNPTRSGYTFKGWFLDSAFKKKVTSIEKGSTGNKTLYAKWAKNTAVTYTITYILDGGTNASENPTSYTQGTAAIKLKKPTKDGYKFVGWYLDKDFKKKITEITKDSTGKKVLYAKWRKIITSSYEDGAFEKVFSSTAEYDDEYFINSSTMVQGGLAKLSMLGASAAYNDNYVSDFLTECGFDLVLPCCIKATKTDNDVVGFLIGSKKLSSEKNTYIIAIIIRGTSGFEWVSNFNIGSGNTHEGFELATKKVYESVEQSLETRYKDANVKFWITGHSRGGAVGNLLAKKLTDKYGRENVYAYTYATPRVSTKGKLSGYENIFNYVNRGDFVTELAPEAWKYKRYGVDIELEQKDEAAMKKEFKKKTGVKYEGYTVGEKESLLSAFLRYAKTQENYNTQTLPSSPKDFFQKGIAYALSGNKKAEKTGYINLAMTALADGSADVVLIKMTLDGMIESKFKHAHCQSTYISWMNTKY